MNCPEHLREVLELHVKGGASDGGFDCLRRVTEPSVRRRLRRAISNPEDVDDLVEDIYRRIWKNRQRLSEFCEKQAWGYIYKTLSHCLFDLHRTRKSHLSLDEGSGFEIADADLEAVDRFLNLIEQERLVQAANDAFLGPLPPAGPCAVLAADFFYMKQMPWPRLVSHFGVSRQELDAWLGHPAVVCHAAFKTLYWPGHRLAPHLLGAACLSESAARALMQNACLADSQGNPPAGWSWTEAEIAVRRFGYGMAETAILRAMEERTHPQQISDVCERCEALFPFNSLMTTLLQRLEWAPEARAALGQPNLWKRLALQYKHDDDITHKDMLQRMAPAAALAGHNLTLGMLNVGLSNGRFYQDLLKWLDEHGGINHEP